MSLPHFQETAPCCILAANRVGPTGRNPRALGLGPHTWVPAHLHMSLFQHHHNPWFGYRHTLLSARFRTHSYLRRQKAVWVYHQKFLFQYPHMLESPRLDTFSLAPFRLFRFSFRRHTSSFL